MSRGWRRFQRNKGALAGAALVAVVVLAAAGADLLAPFDPLVWDRERFERFWGWAYRFEAYTPAARRVRGYYALPMLWRGQAIGWANAAVQDGRLALQPGYVTGAPPRDAVFRRALEDERMRMERFLGL